MSPHLPVLILLSPLAGGGLALAAEFFSSFLARLLAALGLLSGLWLAFLGLPFLLEGGRWHYSLGGWAPPWGIELAAGPLSTLLGCLVLALALLALFYGTGLSLKGGPWMGRFVPAFLSLLVFCLLALLFLKDLFSLYLALQACFLVLAGLLVLGNVRNWLEAFRLLLGGSACASLLLLGVVFLFTATGTVNLSDVQAQLFISQSTRTAYLGGGFLAAGLAYPLCFPTSFVSGSLLERMPSFLTGFLASTLNRVGAYLLFLFLFYAVNIPGSSQPAWLVPAGIPLVLLFFSGFVLAARQKDFLRTLAFLSAAQVGYLFCGFLLGNKSALTGCLMELLSQMLAVAGLFFIAETLREGPGPQPFSRMAGLLLHRPLTGLALVVFAASIVGVPPTGGFFGKWYILEGALEKKEWAILSAVVAAVLFNFFYWVKLAVFLSEHRRTPLSQAPGSLAAKLPFLLLAAALLLLGIFHQEVIHGFLEPALPKAFQDLPVPNVPFLGKQVE